MTEVNQRGPSTTICQVLFSLSTGPRSKFTVGNLNLITGLRSGHFGPVPDGVFFPRIPQINLAIVSLVYTHLQRATSFHTFFDY